MLKKAENNVVLFLVQHGKISQQQFKELIAESREINVPADEILEKKNLLTEENIAWAKSQMYNVQLTDLYGLIVDHTVLSTVPKDVA